jgi:hypothetical protein
MNDFSVANLANILQQLEKTFQLENDLLDRDLRIMALEFELKLLRDLRESAPFTSKSEKI